MYDLQAAQKSWGFAFVTFGGHGEGIAQPV